MEGCLLGGFGATFVLVLVLLFVPTPTRAVFLKTRTDLILAPGRQLLLFPSTLLFWRGVDFFSLSPADLWTAILGTERVGWAIGERRCGKQHQVVSQNFEPRSHSGLHCKRIVDFCPFFFFVARMSCFAFSF